MKLDFFSTISPMRRIAFIAVLHNAWFWVPIWVLYYRRFTNYSGVALLEALSMAVSMLMIVPGGILSDRIGRIRLLIIASICAFLGAIGTGLAPTFFYLILFILLLSFAGGLYQSSIHALIYDTLKSRSQEHRYERVLGKFTTVQMLSAAFASAVGGFLYQLDPRYPWFAVALCTGISVFIITTLHEPLVETVHDSFQQFIKESGKGVALLFRKKWRIGLPLIGIGIFLTTDSSGLWDIQAVEFGFSSTQLGILLTCTYLVLAGISFFMPHMLRRIHEQKVIIGSGMLFLLCWFASSFVFGLSGALLLIARPLASVVFDMKASVIWNRMIPSHVRATTLSTISIIRGIPYIAVSWGMGIVLDTIGIRPLVRTFSFLLLFVCLGTWLLWRSNHINHTDSRFL